MLGNLFDKLFLFVLCCLLRGNMLAKVLSYSLNGINGYPVEIEVDVNAGLPGYDVVGLADTAIKESKSRVKASIKNSMFKKFRFKMRYKYEWKKNQA